MVEPVYPKPLFHGFYHFIDICIIFLIVENIHVTAVVCLNYTFIRKVIKIAVAKLTLNEIDFVKYMVIPQTTDIIPGFDLIGHDSHKWIPVMQFVPLYFFVKGNRILKVRKLPVGSIVHQTHKNSIRDQSLDTCRSFP